ncbi:MAG: thermonuclease family protein, partial [Hyphomicrobiales bacterium]|nr:thermonuclease family protein [Hyphomicrobiales bacterium]
TRRRPRPSDPDTRLPLSPTRATNLALAAALLSAICSAAAAEPQPESCAGVTAGTGSVARVTKDNRLELNDGRTVRLAGIRLPDGAAATRRLTAQVASAPVALSTGDKPTDRYGDLLAQVTTGDGRWLQQHLVAEGDAVVAPDVETDTCTESLLVAERKARAESAGGWSTGAFRVFDAGEPARIDAVGQYVIVSGRVMSVGHTYDTVFLNFGRNWKNDFTITISRDMLPAFRSSRVAPEDLAGRMIRVRGLLRLSGGPAIALFRPEAIEIMD